MRQSFAALLVLGALAIALSACGGKSGDGGSDTADASPADSQTASQEIVIKASNWEFDKPEYIVPKDTPVKIVLELEGGHGIKIPGTDINLGPGRTSAVVTLKEGTYDFRCTIMCGTGHGKMVSKLVVQ